MASAPSSASGGHSPGDSGSTILPFRMHVSQRYLDLTRQKLDLARLPREVQTRQHSPGVGVSKAQLESLVDYWADEYDWRARETYYNETFPQYRLAIHGTRLHFVHRRSRSDNAIPLLITQAWPESFVSVSRIIEGLCDPISTPPRGDETAPSFHIVVPSIPGTGFSDQVVEEGNNIATTAEAFDALMKTLGYQRYIAHGSGWGFRISRMIALMHPYSCMAVHTSNIDVPAPRTNLSYSPQSISIPSTPLSVPGQVPTPVQYSWQEPVIIPGSTPPLSPIPKHQPILHRPQTIAFALCDSPIGLLAYVFDAIRPQSMHESSSPDPRPKALPNAWSQAALIDWTMLYWLPGPEVALRWLANSEPLAQNLWATRSTVPLAISQFGDPGTQDSPSIWAQAYHRVAFVRRRAGNVRFATWERPGDIIIDLRELAVLVRPMFLGVSSVLV